ncbi:MAG: hypothetical protein LW847_02850 [Burkholderiales bacterium]|jgi:hypothetical protein|nr:hypothetical protein [Burkholderiales bacterium]
MSEKSKFWCRWLQAACLAVQAFGAFMVLSPTGTNGLFGFLVLGDAGAIGQFGERAVDYVGLLHAILGSVLVGWGVALLLVVRQFYMRDPQQVSRLVMLSLLFWVVPDTAYSLWSGFWQNAVLNASFIALFAPPLIASRVQRD